MRKIVAICLVLMVTAAAAPAAAQSNRDQRLPATIDLPDGFFPEGIASGSGSTFYVGSLADGTIFRGDYRSGEGEVLTDPVGPFSTVGLTVDHRGRVWAAGGTSGTGRVYDGKTGELLATYPFTGPLESFINDVIVTQDAAWFTDSGTRNSPNPANFQFAGEPRLFRVPLTRGVRLPNASAIEELSVDMPDLAFPNLNGIETAPDNRGLIVAHNTEGTLYRVNRFTGDAQVVDIDHAFAGPDGMVRDGRTLYVVEPGATRVSTVQLSRRGTSGEIKRTVTVPGAETPTTAALFQRGVYVVDARFASMTGPYHVTRIPLTCHRIRANGFGRSADPQPTDPPELVRTVAEIRSGLLKGTTDAAFTVTGPTPAGVAYAGELTFSARQGTLTLDLMGTLDLSTGEFATSGPVRSGTGAFASAAGTLSLDGLQDLTDPAGSFRETVSGEICADLG